MSEKISFSTVSFGYDRKEVDMYVSLLESEHEKAVLINEKAHIKIDELQKSIDELIKQADDTQEQLKQSRLRASQLTEQLEALRQQAPAPAAGGSNEAALIEAVLTLARVNEGLIIRNNPTAQISQKHDALNASADDIIAELMLESEISPAYNSPYNPPDSDEENKYSL